MEIRPIQTADYQAWDAYILAHAIPSVYLTTAWKRAVDMGYGQPTTYLAAFDHHSVVGVLPLVSLKPVFGRSSLVSLPYCDHAGLIAQTPELARAILDRAVEMARQRRAVLEIRSAEPNLAVEQRADFLQVTDKCRMVLEIPECSASLWDGFKSKLRSQVRRAMKNCLTHRIGGIELLHDFYTIFSRNMRDLGSPVHSMRWLLAVLVAFGEAAKIAVVYNEDIPAAAGILLTFGVHSIVPWASSLRKFDSLSPNMLLYWKFLEYVASHGFKFFDFGRSTPGSGTYVFKRQWGAQPSPLYWFREEIASTKKGPPKVGIPLRSALEWSWRKLPVAMANVVGPTIRKQISL